MSIEVAAFVARVPGAVKSISSATETHMHTPQQFHSFTLAALMTTKTNTTQHFAG